MVVPWRVGVLMGGASRGASVARRVRGSWKGGVSYERGTRVLSGVPASVVVSYEFVVPVQRVRGSCV